MAVFYFDLFGSEWLIEELKRMHGNSSVPASKCFIVIGFSSIPTTHLRLLPLWFLFFQDSMLDVLGAKLCC